MRTRAVAIQCFIRAPALVAGERSQRPFYVPENPAYTIVDSCLDSARFTLEKTLARCERGHLASISSFVDEECNVIARGARYWSSALSSSPQDTSIACTGRHGARRACVRGAALVVLAALAIAMSRDAWAEGVPPLREEAQAYDEPRAAGKLSDRALAEVSGIACGRKNPSVLWVHNDSGHGASLYAIDRAGTLIAEVVVQGAQNVDWEDIAIGPAPGDAEGKAPRIFIADTGNNGFPKRGELSIYSIAEPDLKDLPRGRKWRSPAAVELRFRYPEGAPDCEAIAVHPRSGDIVLFTKAPAACAVFRLRPGEAAGAPRVAERLAALRIPDAAGAGVFERLAEPLRKLVTAADIAPDGRRLLLRTYGGLYELALAEGEAFEAVFGKPLAALPAPPERIGEAAAYAADGGIVTVAEGVGAAVYEIRRRGSGGGTSPPGP